MSFRSKEAVDSMNSVASTERVIQEHGWQTIPASFLTRDGQPVDTSGDVWVVGATTGIERLRFDRIRDQSLRWAIMRYAMHRLQTVSNVSGVMFYSSVSSSPLIKFDGLKNKELSFKDALVGLIEDAIRLARNRQQLWTVYWLVRWYVWCADNIAELGFCTEYANELDGMVIPGGPKGEAVRSDDPEDGPLDRTLELPLVLRALESDFSDEYEHIEQQAAVALCVAFGRNPANLVYLDVEDIVNLTEGIAGVPATYVVRMPRIKKRQVNPRDDVRIEPIEEKLAYPILRLVKLNKNLPSIVLTDAGLMDLNIRPLFRRPRGQYLPVPEAVASRAVRVDSARINILVKGFAKRHGIVSPITSEGLIVTPRRFRYTMACGLVEEGISRRELARILDHTDTQHVKVYFELKSKIVRFLDAAVAKKLGLLLNFFRGQVIDSDSAKNGSGKHVVYVDDKAPQEQEEIGLCGKKSLCYLDPPFSCYLCEKFRPYRSADHEKVLNCLLRDREERLSKYEDARLGVQLDDVIIAVAQVAELCKAEA